MKKALVALSAVFLAVAVTGFGLCQTGACPLCHHGDAPAPAGTAALAPTDPVHVMFSGCRSTCGGGTGIDPAQAKVQPAAMGEVTFCPVSGAVFRVGEKSTVRMVGGKPLYFCCEMCAGYFDKNRAEVLAKRGLVPLS